MKNLYSIFDSYLNEFLPPFVAKNNTMAQVSYEQYLSQHPLFDKQITKLFSIGQFDEDKGVITAMCPEMIKIYSKEVNENGKNV